MLSRLSSRDVIGPKWNALFHRFKVLSTENDQNAKKEERAASYYHNPRKQHFASQEKESILELVRLHHSCEYWQYELIIYAWRDSLFLHNRKS